MACGHNNKHVMGECDLPTDYPSLVFALLLPSLAGYLRLGVIEQRFNSATPNVLRQIGYGLFLGYVALVVRHLRSGAYK